MKKIILVLIAIVILSQAASAQINWARYSQSYPSGSTDKASNIGVIAAIPETNNAFWEKYPNEDLVRSLGADASFQHNRPQGFVALNSFDTAKAQFFLHGVNKSNAGEFEFRVMDGDKIIVPWSPISMFTDKYTEKQSGMPQMAYLGGFVTSAGNRIIVDARRTARNEIIATAVVAWKPIKPFLSDVYRADELNIFLKRLARPWDVGRRGEKISKWQQQQTINGSPPGKQVFGPHDNNLVFFLSPGIYKKEQLEYSLTRDNEPMLGWKANDFDNGFIWLTNLEPGDYLLKMRYTAQRQHVTEYPFQIKKPWAESIVFRIIAGILACVSIGFVVFFILHVKQKQRAEDELAKKTKLQLELKSIYAQLNPHFIFNALNSIQGLINKKDLQGANSYLTDFAALMRQSLNNSNKEQTSLDQEILTLDSYLKLEQLRFGFKYEINVDKAINSYESEIPSLLLQPLIENAVKHGVSGLYEKGIITVNFLKQGNDMMVSVVDNGNGFAGNANPQGLGLKLTLDRIKLINEFSKGQTVTLEINNNTGGGTRVNLAFKNWFL